MRKIKAYTVHDGNDQTVIIFASSNVVAHREGAAEMDIDFSSVDYCHRAPEFDQYAPGPVPPAALLDNGWWISCYHCGGKVTLEESDEGVVVDPVIYGNNVFCSNGCSSLDYAGKKGKESAIAAMIELVETKFPGCQIVDVHVYGSKLERMSPQTAQYASYAIFNFTGGKHKATWFFGEDTVKVMPVDIEAFQKLYGKKN